MQQKVIIAITIMTMSLFLMISVIRPAYSLEKLGSGYVTANYFSLTTLLLASYQNNERPLYLTDGYAHIFYCNLVKSKFTDEFEWEKIREIINSEIDKIDKEYYKSFEVSSVVYIGKYDFETNSFPLLENSQINNVGFLSIYSLSIPNSTEMACYDYVLKKDKTLIEIIPNIFVIKLPAPLTINRIRVTPEKAKYLVRLLSKKKLKNRKLYIRFRLNIIGLDSVKRTNWGGDKVTFNGKLDAIDIFVDPEMTIPITSISVDM